MDYQAPPEAPAIVITHMERHPIKEEVIEQVARLLCRADGCDPDGDSRCGLQNFSTSNTMIVPNYVVTTCYLSGGSYYGGYPNWNLYRAPAEKMLSDLFTKTIDDSVWLSGLPAVEWNCDGTGCK